MSCARDTRDVLPERQGVTRVYLPHETRRALPRGPWPALSSQPQGDSNPCRHLERAYGVVQPVSSDGVLSVFDQVSVPMVFARVTLCRQFDPNPVANPVARVEGVSPTAHAAWRGWPKARPDAVRRRPARLIRSVEQGPFRCARPSEYSPCGRVLQCSRRLPCTSNAVGFADKRFRRHLHAIGSERTDCLTTEQCVPRSGDLGHLHSSPSGRRSRQALDRGMCRSA